MKIILFSLSFFSFIFGMLSIQQYKTDYYIDSTINDTVYYKADVMPKYKNGEMDFLIDFLNAINNSSNDDELYKTLLISFVVTKNGFPINCKIEKYGNSYIDDDLEKNVTTAIEGMVGWKNGLKEDEPVNVYVQKKVYLHFQ